VTQVKQLKLKRTHLNIKASFPYDCINLDFCGYYYPPNFPPGMLRINETVEKILEWQFMPGGAASEVTVDDFILTVTCRHGHEFPPQATARLKNLIKNNCRNHATYKKAFEKSRNNTSVDAWARKSPEDFFLAGWPKDIASSARDRGWKTEILDYVIYRRKGYKNAPYAIACLVLKFSRVNRRPEYLPAALHALDLKNRIYIQEISRKSAEGQKLVRDLTEIVAIRNRQARAKSREELPDP
jgi:hypothetical protein